MLGYNMGSVFNSSEAGYSEESDSESNGCQVDPRAVLTLLPTMRELAATTAVLTLQVILLLQDNKNEIQLDSMANPIFLSINASIILFYMAVTRVLYPSTGPTSLEVLDLFHHHGQEDKNSQLFMGSWLFLSAVVSALDLCSVQKNWQVGTFISLFVAQVVIQLHLQPTLSGLWCKPVHDALVESNSRNNESRLCTNVFTGVDPRAAMLYFAVTLFGLVWDVLGAEVPEGGNHKESVANWLAGQPKEFYQVACLVLGGLLTLAGWRNYCLSRNTAAMLNKLRDADLSSSEYSYDALGRVA